jgi:hypothetical protein
LLKPAPPPPSRSDQPPSARLPSRRVPAPSHAPARAAGLLARGRAPARRPLMAPGLMQRPCRRPPIGRSRVGFSPLGLPSASHSGAHRQKSSRRRRRHGAPSGGGRPCVERRRQTPFSHTRLEGNQGRAIDAAALSPPARPLSRPPGDATCAAFRPRPPPASPAAGDASRRLKQFRAGARRPPAASAATRGSFPLTIPSRS